MNNPSQNLPSVLEDSAKGRLITYGDLLRFKSELLHDLKQVIKETALHSKQWLKSHEVRKLLNISPGTLQTLRNNGTIPFSRIGGVVFYNVEDIHRMMDSHKSFTH